MYIFLLFSDANLVVSEILADQIRLVSYNNHPCPWQPCFLWHQGAQVHSLPPHMLALFLTHTHTQANGSPDNWAQLAWSEWNEHQKHPANCYINLFWQSPPITSAFVISSEELPSVGLGFEGNLSFPVLFTFSLFWEEGGERMEIRMVKTSKGACDIYVHNWSTCGYFWFHAQIGLWWILASLCTTGHWVTLRRLILSSVKRSVSRWIQNIML